MTAGSEPKNVAGGGAGRPRLRRSTAVVAFFLPLLAPALAVAEPHGVEETVEQALCRLIDTAAGQRHLPAGFLTRLIWQESSFRSRVVSPAGAQGIAQFMPGTARERGLADPFDPEQAIPASAALLAELRDRFGNLGLAAAAYNGGPARVAAYIAGTGGLPFETEGYVLAITGRTAGDWLAGLKTPMADPSPVAEPGCLARVASLRATAPRVVGTGPAAFAPWGVQLAGNFFKARALASFERARARYATVIGTLQPMVIGTRLRTRGSRAFYRVRLPAGSRQEAAALCGRLHAAGGACVVLRS